MRSILSRSGRKQPIRDGERRARDEILDSIRAFSAFCSLLLQP